MGIIIGKRLRGAILAALALAALTTAPAGAQTFSGDNLGIVSSDNRVFPGTVQLAGTPAAGDVVTTTVTVGGTPYTLAVTARAGDTLQSLVTAAIGALNASPDMRRFGITGLQGNPSLMQYSVTPQRNGAPLPTIAVAVSSGSQMQASVVRQAQDVLDAAPILYLDRSNPSAPVKAGDTIGPIIMGAGNALDGSCCNTAYGMLQAIVLDPRPASLSGAWAIDTACPVTAFGNVCNRMLIGPGIQVFDANSAPPAGGDMGAGTINLPASGNLYRGGKPLITRASLGGYSGKALAIGATSYVGLTSASADIFANLLGLALDGSIRALTLSAIPAPGAGQTVTATVLLNGQPSGLACTISGGAGSCTDAGHVGYVTAPASITVSVAVSARAAAPQVIWSLEYDNP